VASVAWRERDSNIGTSRSHVVEPSDRSAWRIWVADIADVLQWLPTTEVNIVEIDDETRSHALINEWDGSRVR
jgi:hypothetical protein